MVCAVAVVEFSSGIAPLFLIIASIVLLITCPPLVKVRITHLLLPEMCRVAASVRSIGLFRAACCLRSSSEVFLESGLVRFQPFRNKAVFIPKTYEPTMAAANGHMGDFAGLEVR